MLHRHAAVLADAAHTAGPALAVVGALLVLGYVAFIVYAFASILFSDQSGGMKLVWLLFAFCAPFLGSVCWFLIGRRNVPSRGMPRPTSAR